MNFVIDLAHSLWLSVMEFFSLSHARDETKNIFLWPRYCYLVELYKLRLRVLA